MVRLFGELAHVVLDPTVRDPQLRQAIYRRIPAEQLQRAVEESTRIVRPDEDSGFDFLRRRYGHLRQFIPAFLAAFPFRSHIDPDPLLEAIDLLRRLGERQSRHLPRRTAFGRARSVVGIRFIMNHRKRSRERWRSTRGSEGSLSPPDGCTR
jgi:hypothetical protein